MPWSSNLALCPFYLERQRENNIIHCEGVSKGTSIHLVFKGEKWNYLKAHCCADYQSCLIYQSINGKYEARKQG